jgi:hypothetical protein
MLYAITEQTTPHVCAILSVVTEQTICRILYTYLSYSLTYFVLNLQINQT